MANNIKQKIYNSRNLYKVLNIDNIVDDFNLQ